MKALSAEAREEILSIFPELGTDGFVPDPACLIPAGKRQKSLVERHLKNAKPLQ